MLAKHSNREKVRALESKVQQIDRIKRLTEYKKYDITCTKSF